MHSDSKTIPLVFTSTLALSAVLLAKDEQALAKIATDERWKTLERRPDVGLLTDDYSNIVQVLRWANTVSSDLKSSLLDYPRYPL